MIGHHIGERHLGGGDEPVIVFRMKEVRGEFRQLASAEQGVVAHQGGRVDLRIAMLGGVEIEHEGRQRPFHPSQGAREQNKPRPGHLRRGVEIHTSQAFSYLHMILRRKVEGRRIAHITHNLVGAFVSAVGNVLGQNIGQPSKKGVEFLALFPSLLLQGLHLVFQCHHLGHAFFGLSLLTLALQNSDLLGKVVAEPLLLLQGGLHLAARGIEF